jgi:hypothetical protein
MRYRDTSCQFFEDAIDVLIVDFNTAYWIFICSDSKWQMRVEGLIKRNCISFHCLNVHAFKVLSIDQFNR